MEQLLQHRTYAIITILIKLLEMRYVEENDGNNLDFKLKSPFLFRSKFSWNRKKLSEQNLVL